MGIANFKEKSNVVLILLDCSDWFIESFHMSKSQEQNERRKNGIYFFNSSTPPLFFPWLGTVMTECHISNVISLLASPAWVTQYTSWHDTYSGSKDLLFCHSEWSHPQSDSFSSIIFLTGRDRLMCLYLSTDYVDLQSILRK